MNFDEFLALAKEVGGLQFPVSILGGAPSRPWGARHHNGRMSKMSKDEAELREQQWLAWEAWENEHQDDLVFYESWCIGGVTGGSCWGDTPDTPVSGEVEPPFTGLDDLLLKVVPNLSFLLYRKLENELISRGEHDGSGDYYGNRTEYADKSIRIKDLYDFLKGYNLV